MALECSVRSRRSLLPKTGHGLPGENEPSVKAQFARSRRVGLRHEVFNRREAVVISYSMGWHGHRYWFGTCSSLFDMGRGWGLNAADIVREVASIPDSLKNWFYGDNRHEEGKAFGCWVRVGDLDPVRRRNLKDG